MNTVNTPASRNSLQTNRDKRWSYQEYYFGEKDNEDRKNGQGEIHWTGAESIEWYSGTMFRDTMHGEGEYRWRYKGPDSAFVSYEGQFFANHLHGYGVMSYPDGRCFTIGDTNPAIDLLRKFGADSLRANNVWTKLYAKYCTDMDSALCHKDLFDHQYYKGKIYTLLETDFSDSESKDDVKNNTYFAWNNNPIMLHMMKHSYQHDQQRGRVKLNLGRVLNGSRKKFRPAAKHEYDCRNLLMASYLGYTENVVQLVNEAQVFVDVADSLGNTALMYAVVGDQIELIHFLIEAGASVNSLNDSCCTPLGVALMRYLCAARDIPPLYMPQVLLPLKSDTPPRIDQPIEWYILRKEFQKNTAEAKRSSLNSTKSVKAVRSAEAKYTPVNVSKETPDDREYDSDTDIESEERTLYLKINGEFISKMNILFAAKTANYYTVKIFTVRNMLDEIDATEEEMLKGKHTEKPAWAKEIQTTTMKNVLQEDAERDKSVALTKILSTINQLLIDGADPKLVKVPQPAILMATKSGIPELIHHMMSHGVDVNETFSDFLDYTALDVVVAEPFNDKNLELIRVLLEGGAETSHRLNSKYSAIFFDLDDQYKVPDGPTLLHVVIARKTFTEGEAQIQRNLIELLLQYSADPCIQFRGRSPIEYAMLKGFNMLDIFIKSAPTKLNSIINQHQHTILMKLFSRDYFKTIMEVDIIPTLTNLLLLGADPLIECYDEDDRYENIFEFAAKTLYDISPPPPPPVTENDNTKGKIHSKRKTKAKGKTQNVKSKSKSSTREESPLCKAYKEVLGMMKEFSRLLHVRWLQAQLMKEFIDVFYRCKQRHWTVILKQYNNGHKVGLWLTPSRCLEIWSILESTNNKKYKDENILRKLLRCVQFCHKRVEARRAVTDPCTAAEKDIIQTEVRLLMQDHKKSSELFKEIWLNPYVKPELACKADYKYQICFECGLRLRDDKIACYFCELVWFCNLHCISRNSQRGDTVHPCSEWLIEKYFPPAEDESEVLV